MVIQKIIPSLFILEQSAEEVKNNFEGRIT